MYIHTELVRLLEEQKHVFPADPELITDQLHHDPSPVKQRLHQRAARLDRDHGLANRLQQHHKRSQWLMTAINIVWFVLGFFSTYGLMQHNQLNFLFALSAVLGINTLMMLWWMGSFLLPKPSFSTLGFDPAWLLRATDPVGRTMAQLYAHLMRQPDFRWRQGAFAHRLASSALLGMFSATLLLLTVRQYSFNWESTLLQGQHFVRIVSALSWLPTQLGFSVPDTSAILAGRNHADATHAAHWGSLLLGSIMCYGLLPRALAYALCRWQIHRHPWQLDLNLPYYQRILATWQRHVTDHADDFHPDPVVILPNNAPSHAPFDGDYWAVALDMPDIPDQWWQTLSPHQWQNQGHIGERHQNTQLRQRIQEHPRAVRLLVAIRTHTPPDRGSVRPLQTLAQHAKGGLCVYFIHTQPASETAQQWQQLAQEHQWPIITS